MVPAGRTSPGIVVGSGSVERGQVEEWLKYREIKDLQTLTTLPPNSRSEKRPSHEPKDETDFGLSAYVTRISEEKLAQYDPSWYE